MKPKKLSKYDLGAIIVITYVLSKAIILDLNHELPGDINRKTKK